MDPLTRGAGFGTSVRRSPARLRELHIIFFALEAAILALALQMYFGAAVGVLPVMSGHAARDARHHADPAAAVVDQPV
jgi:hypothetical protein